MSSDAATVLTAPAAPPKECAVAPPRPPRVAARLDYIDALRGIACLWVLFVHGLSRWGWGPRPGATGLEVVGFKVAGKVLGVGWLGVHLFIVLSGFCLFYPLVRSTPVSDIRLDVRRFLARRSRRILPPYYAAVVLFALASLRVNSVGHVLKDVGTHLVMIHNLSPRTIATLNGSFWSLALEFQLYLVFPALVVLAARRGLRAAVLVTLGVSLVTQLFVWKVRHPVDWGAAAWLYYSLPGQWFTFAVGMYAAALVARPRPNHFSNALLVSVTTVLPAYWVVYRHGEFGLWRDQLWAIAFGGAIVALSRFSTASIWRSRLLRGLVWLGSISYSLYLIHQPLVEGSKQLVDRLPLNSELRLLLFAFVAAPLLVGLAFMFHVAFERPFLHRPRDVRVARQVA